MSSINKTEPSQLDHRQEGKLIDSLLLSGKYILNNDNKAYLKS